MTLKEIQKQLDGSGIFDSIFDNVDQEKDDGYADLRYNILTAAHEASSHTYRSPDVRNRNISIGHNENVIYAYERDIEYDLFENKMKAVWPDDQSWLSNSIICRSGMSCLWVLLISIKRLLKKENCSVLMWGEYFETRHLFDLLSTMKIKTKLCSSLESFFDNLASKKWDIVYVEPVKYSDDMQSIDIEALIRAVDLYEKNINTEPLFLVFDTTLCGNLFPIDTVLRAFSSYRNLIILEYSSLLKLYQRGMEITNAGMIKIYTNLRSRISNAKMAKFFRISRMLTGTALTLFELISLNNPLSSNRDLVCEYSRQVLHNNSLLALALSKDGIFDHISSPILKSNFKYEWQQSPFVIVKLRERNHLYYEYLQSLLIKLAKEQQLKLHNGSSFGFQHSRFEIYYQGVTEDSICFKIAMGYHQENASRDAIITLLSSLSEIKNFQLLMLEYPLHESEIIPVEKIKADIKSFRYIEVE